MLRTISSSSSDENSGDSIHRWRRSTHQNSKIQLRVSDSAFASTATSFGRGKTIHQRQISSSSEMNNRSQRLIFTMNESPHSINNITDRQVKKAVQMRKYNQIFEYTLRFLYGLLAILFLVALIVPSILIYHLAPKSLQTGLTQLTTYTNHCGGISPYTLWQINDTITITMIINTTQCNFPHTPLYFVSISGLANQFLLVGYGAIYLPTNKSFQIYTRGAYVGFENSALLLSQAQLYLYDISWTGFYK